MKIMKWLHKWLGVIVSFFLLFFALSGIVLNHRSFFSPVDVNRKLLPPKYRYANWNLAAVRSAATIGHDSVLVYGNIGIWLTDSAFSKFRHFSDGLQKGIDNRKTMSVVRSEDGNVWAGTLSGLYRLSGSQWQQVPLPGKENRIAGLMLKGDSLLVLTRSHLFVTGNKNGQPQFSKIQLPHPAGFKNEVSLFKALWTIHSGEIFGLAGKLVVDAVGLIMIFLSFTGIVWFLAPDLIRKLKNQKRLKQQTARLNRFSRKWHNHIGIWAVAILIITTLTGIFLRPPLLIAIISNKLPAWKYTALHNANPWNDKLRGIQYDKFSKNFVFSTSDGFFLADEHFSDSLRRLRAQPPVSVMGINVFEQPREGLFIVGSFSGIYRWVPATNYVQDMITGLEVQPRRGGPPAFGNIAVAGYISAGEEKEYIFDYDGGVFSRFPGNKFPEMPDEIRKKSPLPLWNTALEIHTGRIYYVIFGKFQPWFIPVMGLLILIVLVSGIFRWFKEYNRRKRVKAHCKQALPHQ
jgi:hypothetical protein